MNNDVPVLHRSRTPLYLQVAQLMRQKIEKKDWAFGAQIPTLDQLENDYEVSRITLRAALNELEKQGLVRRSRGSGTFVNKDLSDQRWFKLAGNLDELVDMVANLEIRLLSVDQESRALTPGFAFGKVGPAYHRMQRVHYRDDVPYCLIEVYLAKAIFDLDPEGFRTKPVVLQLAKRDDVTVAHAKQVMHITVCDEETATHLSLGVGDPIADVCRTFLDAESRIIYYAHIQYPAHMIHIEMDLLAPLHHPSSGGRSGS